MEHKEKESMKTHSLKGNLKFQWKDSITKQKANYLSFLIQTFKPSSSINSANTPRVTSTFFAEEMMCDLPLPKFLLIFMVLTKLGLFLYRQVKGIVSFLLLSFVSLRNHLNPAMKGTIPTIAERLSIVRV